MRGVIITSKVKLFEVIIANYIIVTNTGLIFRRSQYDFFIMLTSVLV